MNYARTYLCYILGGMTAASIYFDKDGPKNQPKDDYRGLIYFVSPVITAVSPIIISARILNLIFGK